LQPFPQPPKNVPHDALPTSWTAADIGDASPGGQRVSGNNINIFAGGADIFGKQDAFRFVSRPLRANDTLSAAVTFPLDTSEYAKAGLMIRSGPAADAAFVMINVFPNGTVGFCTRAATGRAATEKKFYPGADSSISLRIIFHDGRASAEFRDADGHWIETGAAALPVDSNTRIGYAVTSHDVQSLTRAAFAPLNETTSP
jgi:hypothetical protein